MRIRLINTLKGGERLAEPVMTEDKETLISKGTILPDYSIVASNSIVNKDFSNCGKYCFYAGYQKIKGTNIKRIFDSKKGKELDIKYSYTRRHL